MYETRHAGDVSENTLRKGFVMEAESRVKNEVKGTVGALFDLSFTEFVTIRVIRVLFIIGVVLSAVSAIGMIVSGFDIGTGAGVLALLLSPVVFILPVLLVRIWCEMIIVVFRIAENSGKLVAQVRPPIQ